MWDRNGQEQIWSRTNDTSRYQHKGELEPTKGEKEGDKTEREMSSKNGWAN